MTVFIKKDTLKLHMRLGVVGGFSWQLADLIILWNFLFSIKSGFNRDYTQHYRLTDLSLQCITFSNFAPLTDIIFTFSHNYQKSCLWDKWPSSIIPSDIENIIFSVHGSEKQLQAAVCPSSELFFK